MKKLLDYSNILQINVTHNTVLQFLYVLNQQCINSAISKIKNLKWYGKLIY